MQKQKQVFEAVEKASLQMENLWKQVSGRVDTLGVSKEKFLDSRGCLGAVWCNLRNFSLLSFVPPEARSLPPPELERLNEAAWQTDQRDPGYHQELRKFFPNGRIPTSLDMTRLGVALLAETNLLHITDVPTALDRVLDPSVDPVEVARQIVKGPPPAGHSKEWSMRLKPLLDYRPEDLLRSDPKFAVLVAAIKNFLDDFEAKVS